jgi:hypothetical protein
MRKLNGKGGERVKKTKPTKRSQQKRSQQKEDDDHYEPSIGARIGQCDYRGMY